MITLNQTTESAVKVWLTEHQETDWGYTDRTAVIGQETPVGRLYFFARLNGRIVGAAALMNNSLYLPKVWVVPEARRQGVGRTLVDGLRANTTTVPLPNPEALAFFEALGFKESARTANFVILQRYLPPTLLSVQ